MKPSIGRKRSAECEKENLDIKDTQSKADVIASGRMTRTDSSESITNKCGSWSLGNDVKSNPPLLESMGLGLLHEPLKENRDLSMLDCTSSCPTSASTSPSNESHVLQPSCQNRSNQSEIFQPDDAHNGDFFVFKRRRLDIIAGEDKINTLADENLLMIFGWLNKQALARCAQVCKRWKNICFDDSLWKRLDLGGKALRAGTVGRVLLRGVKLLRLAKTEIYTPIFCPKLEDIPSYQEFPVRLTHLDLSMAAVSSSDLEEILHYAKRLKKVSLEHCTLSGMCCTYLAQNTQLDTLNLAMCYNLNGQGISEIFKHCTSLESVNLAWTHLTASDLNMLTAVTPSSLKYFNLSGCRETLFDQHIQALGGCSKKLIQLDLSDSIKITANVIMNIIELFPNLESLSLARCYGVSPEAYIELRTMTSLTHLDVFGIFAESTLESLRRSMSSVKINRHIFSQIARPTVGIKRTSIWNLRVRD